MTRFIINNIIDDQKIWSGIGGHFDSLSQILHEFIDNSISNLEYNNHIFSRMILITLEELQDHEKKKVKITIEDAGSGIEDIDEAFKLGGTKGGTTPRNEHGFGIKHALASANPQNDNWNIYTRTEDDAAKRIYKKVSHKYKTIDFQGQIIDEKKHEWPGQYKGSGTFIEFTCDYGLYKSLVKGMKGNFSDFNTILIVLIEELGFVYQEILTNVQIKINAISLNGTKTSEIIKPVMPTWNHEYNFKEGEQDVCLANGKNIKIKYSLGTILKNNQTKKFYKPSMNLSGVEIRINGRLIVNNVFQEIWNLEKHNSYNEFFMIVNLISEDRESLPKTRTSKNGFREGDERLIKLYEWIRSICSKPGKNKKAILGERELLNQLYEYKINSFGSISPGNDTIEEIKKQFPIFERSVYCDLFIKFKKIANRKQEVEVYQCIREKSTIQDLYKLRMYWDGLVKDDILPTKAILIATENRELIEEVAQHINKMKDEKGENYNLECLTWSDYKIL